MDNSKCCQNHMGYFEKISKIAKFGARVINETGEEIHKLTSEMKEGCHYRFYRH